jgi:hypothetical protein
VDIEHVHNLSTEFRGEVVFEKNKDGVKKSTGKRKKNPTYYDSFIRLPYIFLAYKYFCITAAGIIEP